jgi:adenine deaminase
MDNRVESGRFTIGNSSLEAVLTGETEKQQKRILAAAGKIPSDLIFHGGGIVNVFTGEIEYGDLAVYDGIIAGIGNYADLVKGDWHTKVIDCTGRIICPGFMDGHIHIESSMLSPAEFAAAVIPHGTTAVITDPHEIVNVAGLAGLDYMLEASKGLPIDVFIMLPSCVPATSLDESGAVLKARDLAAYMEHNRVLGLAELMDFYGTAAAREDIVDKITLTQKYKKVIDGHAPGLSSYELNAYAAAGVTSDHECSDQAEALEKLRRGQWIMIREGTAAQNMEALMPLLKKPYSSRCMLVTDDKHPGDLLKQGHIDYLIKKAVKNGADPITAIQMATINTAAYFGLLGRGAAAPGYMADLVILKDLESLTVEAVYKNGKLAVGEGTYAKSEVDKLYQNQIGIEVNAKTVNKPGEKYDWNISNHDGSISSSSQSGVFHSFHVKELMAEDFYSKESGNYARVIELIPGELLTKEVILPYTEEGFQTRTFEKAEQSAESENIEKAEEPGKSEFERAGQVIKAEALNQIGVYKDIIKLAVIERHHNTGHIGLGYLKGYGLKSGAIASSVSHDSHNLIVAGTNEEDMCLAANQVSKNQGGLAIALEGKIIGELALPIAGLMCGDSAEQVDISLTELKNTARKLGINEGIDPFMTLAFLSLPVIPELRLTTKGLADVRTQKIVKTRF